MHFHEFCDGKTRLRFEGQRVHTARFFLQVQFYAVAFSMLTFAQTSLNVVLPTLPLSTSFHTYSGSSFAGATLRDHFLYSEAVLLCSCVFGANFCAGQRGSYSTSFFAGATLRDRFLYCEALLLRSRVFDANFCADIFECCSTNTSFKHVFPHLPRIILCRCNSSGSFPLL
jgi:multidrug transporter EmrE-like cation transporter